MSHSKAKIRLVDLAITDFSKEGLGCGHFMREDGTSSLVEVPFTVPGDQVKASLLKRRKGKGKGQLVELTVPSPNRIEPRCIHFGHCGGCRWQQISYAQQLSQKEEWILGYLKPYLAASTVIHSIIPSTPPWHYRNKIELTFSSDKAQNQYLGFIIYGSRGKVFKLMECHLVSSWMSQAVHVVREWWAASNLDAYHAMRDTGSLRTLTLREGQRTGDRMVILTVSGNADYALKQEQLQIFVSTLQAAIKPENPEHRLSIFLRIQQIAKGQRTNFYEMHLDGPDHICESMSIQPVGQAGGAFTFHISPMAFFQPNTSQAEKLYTRVAEMIKWPKEAIVYDLYCGTGTLGICLARYAKKVIGIELSPESVLDARENIKINGVTNAVIHQGDVAEVLARLTVEDAEKPDMVIVDPPRAGLDAKALRQLIEINAAQIVYVSCNPATQALNLEALIQAGYQLLAVQPVDQFPQTVHVENIVILEKN